MVLLCLLTVSSLVQTAVQEIPKWDDKEKALQKEMHTYILSKLSSVRSINIRLLYLEEFDVCRRRNGTPYVIARYTIYGTCSREDKSRCGLHAIPRMYSSLLKMDCQVAAEINGCDRPIAALCYQNTPSGRIPNVPIGELCTKWRYPGTELPRLRLPEHLKSPDADVLLYEPVNVDSFNCDSSEGLEVNTNHWIRNPYERTGFSGKGNLEKFGPNSAIYLVITRYSNGTNKALVESIENYVAVPVIRVKDATISDDLIKRVFSQPSLYCRLPEINFYAGYLKSRLNTDNAWLEGGIIHVHNPSEGCLSLYTALADAISRQYRWQALPNSTTPRDFAQSFLAKYK